MKPLTQADYTIRELAARWGKSVGAVQSYVNSSRLQGHCREPGHARLFAQHEVHRFEREVLPHLTPGPHTADTPAAVRVGGLPQR